MNLSSRNDVFLVFEISEYSSINNITEPADFKYISVSFVNESGQLIIGLISFLPSRVQLLKYVNEI